MLVEGPAGVGKTELAKAVSRATERRLIRLQCYEGLDEAKALYEWNYRKQLLRIQTEAADTGWEQVQDDIFGEEFLLARPLLNAIAAEEPVVLLIDEIDKTDQEFEAMLLEVLSDFQISIPELGVVEARTQPLVLLTSNNSRELTEALKRRCLYLWLDYPDVERELEIVHLHAPELDQAIARKLVEVDPHGALARPQEAALDRGVDRLGARTAAAGRRGHRPRVLEKTMSIIVKHRTDLDLVAERVGVKLGDGVVGAQRGRRAGNPAPLRRHAGRARPDGMAPRLLEFADELRREGVAVGTTRAARRLPRARRGELDLARGLPQALAATLAKSQEDRHVLDVLFDRFFFRAVEREAIEQGLREERFSGARGARPRGAARAHPRGGARRQRRRDARPRPARDRRLRPPGRGLRA